MFLTETTKYAIITSTVLCITSASSFSIIAHIFTIATISEQSNKTANKISSKIQKYVKEIQVFHFCKEILDEDNFDKFYLHAKY